MDYFRLFRYIHNRTGQDLADGDIILVRGGELVRLPLGLDGQVLTAVPAGADKIEWQTPSGGGGDGGLAAHVAAADPHTGYQKESEKGGANGYASLDGSTLVPVAQLPTASTTAKGVAELATSVETTAGLVVQASDTRLSDSRAPNGSGGGDLGASYPNPTVIAATGTDAVRHPFGVLGSNKILTTDGSGNISGVDSTLTLDQDFVDYSRKLQAIGF